MLKSLELFGFKSFADRTRFDFPHGITCVVGPNGSGKSNVVDAMKWILGDQSPKSLRGSDMLDVIFNGSKGRKPSAFAEAILTFDNSQHILPVETEEVTIGRRLWRSGDSEYLINGATARLKDIREAFMGTGAGASAYSIIEQGRVGQILQANAAARRIVFEEAAGISRFKQRKTDALRKLEKVSQNLLRLQDIVNQVGSQLNSVRNQASKAAKYREISEELKQLWFGLVADDFHYQSAELQRLEAGLATTGRELDVLSSEQRQIEERLTSFDTEIAAVDDQLREAERRAGSVREDIVSQESTLRHETGRLRETESELIRLRRQQSGSVRRLAEIQRELAETQHGLDTFDETSQSQQEALGTLETQLQELSRQMAAARSTIEAAGRRRSELQTEASRLEQQSSHLTAQLAALQEARRAAEQKRDQIALELDAAQVEFGARQAAVNEFLSQSSELSEVVRSIRRRQQKLLKEQQEIQQLLLKLREKRSAAQARATVLEDLEERQEGVGIGVREILNRARTADYAPWNLIRGSVADLLDVELENAALLEVALGSRAQLIVLENLEPLIEYLSRGSVRIDGRVGFLELPPDSLVREQFSDAAVTQAGNLFDGDPDVVSRADALISERCLHHSLAARLLSTTWIVTDVSAARRLAATHPGQRFVTLQGELLEPDGTLYTGSLRGETTVLSRRSELRRLKNDIIRLDQQVDSQEKQLQSLSQQLAGIENELAAAATQRDEAGEQLVQVRSALEGQQRILDRLTSDRAALEQTIQDSHAQQIAVETQLTQLQSAGAHVDSEREQTEDEIVQREEALAELERERSLLMERQTEARLQIARHEQRREGLQSTVRRLRDESALQLKQSDENRRRIAALETRHRDTELIILNATASIAELMLQSEQSSQQVQLLAVKKDRLRSVRGELVEQDNHIRQQRRLIGDRQHEEELRVRDIRHQLAQNSQRLEEEHGLPLAEVLATGASAFRTLLIERGLLDASAGGSADAPRSHEAENGIVEEAFVDESVVDQGSDAETADSEPADAGRPVVSSESETPLVLCEFAGLRYSDVRAELEEEVNRQRRRLKSIGSVNTDALAELDELEGRYNHFHAQLMDLTEAKATLEDIIRKVNVESRRIFLESFEAIRREFRELFRKLFGGGDGDIILEDPDDVLDCGIEIVARPPGKELRSISLLSGGEKTMTAVALLLAIFRSRPSPFCILDEVDAALDDGNVERYAGVIREFRDMTQFIMISHRKRTMTAADLIYGVTMEQSGVSKRLTVRFEDVGEDGHFKASPAPDHKAA